MHILTHFGKRTAKVTGNRKDISIPCSKGEALEIWIALKDSQECKVIFYMRYLCQEIEK